MCRWPVADGVVGEQTLALGRVSADLDRGGLEFSLRTTSDPSDDSVSDLRAMGVRYLWVDLLAEHGDRLEDRYDLQFSNDAVAIYAVRWER